MNFEYTERNWIYEWKFTDVNTAAILYLLANVDAPAEKWVSQPAVW